MEVRGIEYEDVDWIHVVEDKDQWWTLVNAVMNIRFI
jgi:hypothetical protein